MSIERGNFSREEEKMSEVQIGTGDPINVTAVEKITYEQKGIGEAEPTKKKLPAEQLRAAQKGLSALPFRIGEKEYIATYPRTAHEASVTISPRSLVYDAPESEKRKKVLGVRFTGGLQTSLGFERAKNLTFEQRDTSSLGKVSIIRFETDEALRVGDDEIGEVRLFIPVEQPK